MNVAQSTDTSVADAYLALLSARGVDYFFGNAGTDFPPIIEAFAKAAAHGHKVPTPVVVPHESVAVAMAHGYYQMTGRAQAVMVHVHVGTANAICNIINAADQKVPILFTAGRTPVHEEGPAGARNRVPYEAGTGRIGTECVETCALPDEWDLQTCCCARLHRNQSHPSGQGTR